MAAAGVMGARAVPAPATGKIFFLRRCLQDCQMVHPALRAAGVEEPGLLWREIENRLTCGIEEVEMAFPGDLPRGDGSEVRKRLQTAEWDGDLLASRS